MHKIGCRTKGESEFANLDTHKGETKKEATPQKRERRVETHKHTYIKYTHLWATTGVAYIQIHQLLINIRTTTWSRRQRRGRRKNEKFRETVDDRAQ